MILAAYWYIYVKGYMVYIEFISNDFWVALEKTLKNGETQIKMLHLCATCIRIWKCHLIRGIFTCVGEGAAPSSTTA